jgi:hypothetical protein
VSDAPSQLPCARSRRLGEVGAKRRQRAYYVGGAGLA